MKKRNMIILLLAIGVVCIGVFLIKKYGIKQEEFVEYIPQEEISEEQVRQTVVTLYFKDIETNELVQEARMADVKELMEEPYINIMKLLLEGPKGDKLIRVYSSRNKNKQGKLRRGYSYSGFKYRVYRKYKIRKRRGTQNSKFYCIYYGRVDRSR